MSRAEEDDDGEWWRRSVVGPGNALLTFLLPKVPERSDLIKGWLTVTASRVNE